MWAISEKFHEGRKLELGPECWVRLREWWRGHTKWEHLVCSGGSEGTAVSGTKEHREQVGGEWGTFRLRSLDYILRQHGIMRDLRICSGVLG